jgi:acyl-homoserine lactone acylase PvdQ
MKTIEIKWSTDDVLMVADKMEVELSEKEADEILDRLLRYHDANVGINWDVIESHIEDLLIKQTD